MGRIIMAKGQYILKYINTISYFDHTLHYGKTRPLKIYWCNSAALWLSPMALRMWSQVTLCFYLGIIMAQFVLNSTEEYDSETKIQVEHGQVSMQ